jgi:MSHA biogenesis protein MshN
LLAKANFLSPAEQVFYQAKMLVSQQREDQAMDLLETHLADAEKDENYRALLAGLYQKNGKPLEAANHYRRLLTVFGDKPAYWLGFALSQDALNQPQAALQAYQRVNQYNDLPPQVQTYIQQRLAALQQ